MKPADGAATACSGRLGADVVQRPELEVVMTKILTAAMVVVLLVGTALTATNLQGRHEANRQGLMPEVTVTAEMPRLVMPTVEVHAVRMVAMSGSDLHVY
jgi:hypothetical protein